MKVARIMTVEETTCRTYLAERIATAMYQQELSLRGAAAKCGVSKAHLCNLLLGAQSPSLETVLRVMRGLNIPTLLTDLELML